MDKKLLAVTLGAVGVAITGKIVTKTMENSLEKSECVSAETPLRDGMKIGAKVVVAATSKVAQIVATGVAIIGAAALVLPPADDEEDEELELEESVTKEEEIVKED